MTPRTRRVGLAALAVSTTLAMTLTSTGASAANDGPRPAAKAPVAKTQLLKGFEGKIAAGLDTSRSQRQTVFVTFAGKGAADAARGAQGAAARRSATARRAEIARQASDVLAAAKRADGGATRVFTVSNAVPGAGMVLNPAAIAALARRNDVVKISRIVPKSPSNANTANLVQAINTWKYAGGTGKGVRIGVIDTGLDYTHADFGGPGTVAAYDEALANETSDDWRTALPAAGRAKVIGGYDFAGNDYDADPTSDTYQPVPHEDGNPLDCNEHGTHVAGTAAGYGVNKWGKTFAGDYATRTRDQLMDMKVGPGMAPEASIFALKVFGCDGSTDVVIPALDRALDPNGDGDFSDHLDIVNMSLGSDFGVVDDPENDVIDELTSHGVLSVISMGNNGDLTDTGGSPGNAMSSLAVASSVDSYQLRDGLIVDGPASVDGTQAVQFSVAYDWMGNGPTGAPVTGDVVAIPGDNADGCDTLSPEDAAKVAGKVAWLEWDDNDSTRRCGSVGRSGKVAAAGAIGAVFTSSLDVFGAGITGSTTIPVVQLPKSGTDKLRPAVDAGTLRVTFDGALRSTIKDITPSITDTISSFTSRGTHGSIGVVKPDVSAPGDTISSAGMSSGNDVLTISGTSMAAPLTTGVAALVKSMHKGWTPGQIKAAVMNTAGHDLWTEPGQKGHRYGPARVGSGRVDALRAVNTRVLAWTSGPNIPVSASFGVVPVPVSSTSETRTKQLNVSNTGKTAVTVKLSYEAINDATGVSYSVSPQTLTIQPGRTRAATVTMTVVPRWLRHTMDATMQVNQLDLARQFVSDESGRILVKPGSAAPLRVPVYGAAKPVSTTTATAVGSQLVMTGQGFNQGTGASAYRSFASVMQLGATSGTLPTCLPGQVSGCTTTASERSGDLKYVGAGSSGDMLWFGIATRGQWATLNTMTPYVDFDVDGDDEPDFETYVQNAPDTDVLLAWTVDIATGETVDIEAVNFNTGDVDTNVFDTDVIMLPVWKGAVGLPTNGSSTWISYSVGTFSGYTGADIDHSATVEFDAGDPALATDGPLFVDAGDTAIDFAARGNGVKALVFHLHGAAGQRAEVIDLP